MAVRRPACALFQFGRGEERAACGKGLIERLARRLTERYGPGYSATNRATFVSFTFQARVRFPMCSRVATRTLSITWRWAPSIPSGQRSLLSPEL